MPLAAAACPSTVGLARPLCGARAHPRRQRRFRLEASSSTPAPATAAADEGAAAGPCPVVRFGMDDFAVADRVSVGLHGRSDEMIFEATVRDPSSELYGSTVVLRQLKSSQAKRRGRRALEVAFLSSSEMLFSALDNCGFRRLSSGSCVIAGAEEAGSPSDDVRLLRTAGPWIHHFRKCHRGGGWPVHLGAWGKLFCYFLKLTWLLLNGVVSFSGFILGPDCSRQSFSCQVTSKYHGSYSLRHWLQLSDWLPTLEATLALDEEQVRRVGDDSVGGPAVTRQLRLIRILMRDLLIGVNYLHSHGLAHTELRLENVHVSPIDKHVKVSSLSFFIFMVYLSFQVGILGNAADFHDGDLSSNTVSSSERRKMMIAFDIRCVGFIMAKMVLRELMDPSTFFKFKSFLTKVCFATSSKLYTLGTLCFNPYCHKDICVDALRHPFLCGPKWRINPSVNIIRWGLGSTTVRMAEDYIYGPHQNWLQLLPGRWRLLYCTGRHIGLTLRQPTPRILISDVFLTFAHTSESIDPVFSVRSDIGFRIMPESDWPHDKSGTAGTLSVTTSARMAAGRIYISEQDSEESRIISSRSSRRHLRGKWRKVSKVKELPASLPTVRIATDGIDVSMSCSSTLNVSSAQNVLQEIRTQTPPEMFDLSKVVCGTYIDARLMILRGVNGSALVFARSNPATDS
ncbi:hypothetical protein PR202_ga10273 [Eleusine coracana subsp. coracana]|uniref:Protein kinase domain-containing protein n=1 Tax=Eleusine coracana subsp. coracana TaxID=191504 RepID=A0AAV5C692_ELECO|nr:hypothetical protein PR202_ga10273 [Eleusine coracana subsp. coracana]